MTGSFKARGGGNKLLKLSKETRANGIVAASTGNHGCGVANMARQLQCNLDVYCAENASDQKVAKM